MKRFKTIIFVLGMCLCASLTFTSCDDYEPEEIIGNFEVTDDNNDDNNGDNNSGNNSGNNNDNNGGNNGGNNNGNNNGNNAGDSGGIRNSQGFSSYVNIDYVLKSSTTWKVKVTVGTNNINSREVSGFGAEFRAPTSGSKINMKDEYSNGLSIKSYYGYTVANIFPYTLGWNDDVMHKYTFYIYLDVSTDLDKIDFKVTPYWDTKADGEIFGNTRTFKLRPTNFN